MPDPVIIVHDVEPASIHVGKSLIIEVHDIEPPVIVVDAPFRMREAKFIVGTPGSLSPGDTTFTLVDTDLVPIVNQKVFIVQEGEGLFERRDEYDTPDMYDYTYNPLTGIVVLMVPVEDEERFRITAIPLSRFLEMQITVP